MQTKPALVALKFFLQVPSVRKVIRPYIAESFRRYSIFAPIHLLYRLSQSIFFRALDIHDEIRFESKFGLQTSFVIKQGDLGFSDRALQEKAARYRPVSPRRVSRAVSYLKRDHLNGILDETTFVDYGSGAGRALIIASEQGFKKIVGVELSPELVSISKENINHYLERQDVQAEIKTIQADARTYTPPRTSVVAFFFDPFGHDIFDIVIQNLKGRDGLGSKKLYIIDVRSSYDYEKQGFQLLKTMHETRIYQYIKDNREDGPEDGRSGP